MSIRTPYLVVILVAGGLLGTSLMAARLHRAESSAQDARAELDRVTQDARSIVRLRSLQETATLGEPPQDDLIARLQFALAESGISASTLRDVERTADRQAERTARTSSVYRRRDVRVVLEPLDPPALGRVLDYWGRNQPLWVVTGVNLDARRGKIRSGEARYTVRLQLSAVYAATQPTGAAQP